MNFISNKSLNNGTFSQFKRFLTSYTTRDMKIQIFPSRNFKTIGHHTWHLASIKHTYNSLAKTLHVWRVKMNFVSDKELKQQNIFPFQALSYALQNQRYENSKLAIAKSWKRYHKCRRISLLQFAGKIYHAWEWYLSDWRMFLWDQNHAALPKFIAWRASALKAMRCLNSHPKVSWLPVAALKYTCQVNFCFV